MSDVEIKIIGLDKVIDNLGRLRTDIKSTLRAAGDEAGKFIINQRGLRNYPPETAANRLPPPYYIRGVGMQYKNKNKGGSQKYGTKFYIASSGYNTKIGNNATYARYLAGEEQAAHMAAIGWKKLIDVAQEQLANIVKIYQGWIDRLIARHNL